MIAALLIGALRKPAVVMIGNGPPSIDRREIDFLRKVEVPLITRDLTGDENDRCAIPVGFEQPIDEMQQLASGLMSPLIQSHDRGLGQRVEMQVEPDHRARAVRIHIELLGLHGEDREQIALRMVSRRRTRSAVARRREIGACLQRAGRQVAAAASRPLRDTPGEDEIPAPAMSCS